MTMCGILGQMGNFLSDSKLDSALDAINHRGPDATFKYRNGSTVMGMNRLAIVDLKGGQQPFVDKTQRYICIYNGEIYNSTYLRRLLLSRGINLESQVDGAVLPDLFNLYGEKFTELLDGMYAIAIYDSKDRALYLSRDPMGEKPLYYSVCDNTFRFGSTVMAITHLGGPLSLDYQSLYDLPTFLWVPEPDTTFHEVKAVMPGETVSFRDGALKHYRYGYEPSSLSNEPESDLPNQLLDIVERNIITTLTADVPIGAFLSSGLDSSIVSLVASKNLGYAINTFCVEFPDGPDPYHGQNNESQMATHFASSLETNHTNIPMDAKIAYGLLDHFVTSADQPFAVTSGLGVLAVAKRAQQEGVKVLLSGDGADELFFGYSWYDFLPVILSAKNPTQRHLPLSNNVTMQSIGIPVEARLIALSQRNPAELILALHYYATESEKRMLFSKEFLYDNDLSSSARIFSELNRKQSLEELDILSVDRSVYLTQEMMRKMDRMTMAFSVEGRVPFVRKEIVQFALSLSVKQLRHDSGLKGLLKESFKGHLPGAVINRPKHGFNFPIERWLKQEWEFLVGETFSSSSFLYKMGLIDKNSLKSAQRLLNSEVKLHGHTLFSFIVMEKWLSGSQFSNKLS